MQYMIRTFQQSSNVLLFSIHLEISANSFSFLGHRDILVLSLIEGKTQFILIHREFSTKSLTFHVVKVIFRLRHNVRLNKLQDMPRNKLLFNATWSVNDLSSTDYFIPRSNSRMKIEDTLLLLLLLQLLVFI